MAKSPCSEEAATTIGLLHNFRPGLSESSPLIILVHGRAGTRNVMWAFERLLPSQCWIISPQAPLPDQSEGGFSWWSMESGSRDPVSVAAAATCLGRFIEDSERYYGLTPSVRIAIGFSQGAAVLSVLSHTAVGEVLSGVAFLAGFVIEDDAKPLSVRKFFVGHGACDETISLSKAKRGVAYLERRGAEVQVAFDDVGHKVGTTATRSLKEWVSSFVRP